MGSLRRTDSSFGFIQTLAPDLVELVRQMCLECAEHVSVDQLSVVSCQLSVVSSGAKNPGEERAGQNLWVPEQANL